MKKRPNLLLLGGSGGVATVFLKYLTPHRDFLGKLILLSRRNTIKYNKNLDHKKLNYTYIEGGIDPYNEKEYHKILKKYKIEIVLDLTTLDTIPLLEATNKFGASYINTSLNADDQPVADLVSEIYPKKHKINKAPHILCAGMNPGIVNMWVRFGIEKFGKPEEIIHFEYDTSKPKESIKTTKILITWSPHEFLVESVRDPSGFAIGRKKIKPVLPNAVSCRADMEEFIKPIAVLNKYPRGFPVLHEENLTLSYRYNIPSKFIYSIDNHMMDLLLETCKKKKICEEDFVVIKNTDNSLEGADNIGVILNYDDKKVYYFNSMDNVLMMGVNATYFQVVIGIFAALCTLLFNKIKKGINFTEDLFRTNYKDYVFDNMEVQEFVFSKNKGKLKLANHNTAIKSTRNIRFKHVYI